MLTKIHKANSFKKWTFMLVYLLLAAMVAGCGADREKAPVIKLGLLPIVDNLPFWVAEQEGFFAAEGIQVELVSFESAMERDAALTAGQIDGALGDVLALAALNSGGTKARAVSIGQGVTPEEGRFALLSAPNSGITSPEQLKGVEIAMSLNSIIEYVADQLLANEGFKPEEIKKVAILKIPQRVEALLNGTVQAAVLPDPLAALAQLKGANLVLDDTGDNITQTVIFFRDKTLTQNHDDVVRVMRAYAAAVEQIQADPDKYNGILAEKARVPAEVLQAGDRTGMTIGFSAPVVPREEDINRVLDWMSQRGLLSKAVSYEDLVDRTILNQ